VTIPPSTYFALGRTEGSGFLNASHVVFDIIDPLNARYRTTTPPPWRVPQFEIIREDLGRSLSPCDISLYVSRLILSPAALDALAPFLTTGGELLPIATDDGQNWQMFTFEPPCPLAPLAEITAKGIIRRNHADMTKPLPKTPRAGVMPWRRVKGRGDFVRWFDFDETTVAGRHIFRAQYEGKPETLMFVSRAFVEAAVAHGLRGLDYHVTAKPEGPLWHTDPRDKDFPFWY
jgi:hypothetical protein